jgi:putative hydrolase of the HAD superfamily
MAPDSIRGSGRWSGHPPAIGYTPRALSTTILFDAGGTLVFPNFARVAAELAVEGVAADAASLERADVHVRFALDRPEVIATTTDGDRFRRYFDGLAGAAGLDRMPDTVFARLDDYHRTHNLWEAAPPHVAPTLERLGRRFRMAVVSNANGTVRAKLERMNLAHHFELIVDSHEEGVEKPDPRLFHIALERMGVAPAQAAYVGDLYHVDVAGAAAAGLTPFLLDPFDLYGALPVTRVRELGELALWFPPRLTA